AKNDAIGASGLVTKLPTHSTQGRMRFSTPVMDSDEWELPAMYLLGEKYIEAIHSMSKSENSKLVVLPADIPAAVRGIMSNAK
ncbi:MAG: hypothetical protein HN910_01840, partial [Porticoccaceae bacterium]|nr:hypothetical protein [Porticoccaceae bacterium]